VGVVNMRCPNCGYEMTKPSSLFEESLRVALAHERARMIAAHPHARTGDPSTSHEAVPEHLTEQALRVLFSYRDGEPLLDFDAYRRAGFGPHARDGQRCSDLRHAGFIERTGKRKLTPSGKFGHLCRITSAGQDYLQLNPIPDDFVE
jgi:hypothetical protein